MPRKHAGFEQLRVAVMTLTRPRRALGSSSVAREMDPLRRLSLVRAERIGQRHLEPELAQRADQRQELLALMRGVCGWISGKFRDAYGVVLRVPRSGSAKRLELRGRKVIDAGG